MRVSTISYFIGGVGFVFIGLSIAFVTGVFSAIAGLIILVVGSFLMWAGYRDYKDLKKRDKLNDWR
jgi:hypothetical protein